MAMGDDGEWFAGVKGAAGPVWGSRRLEAMVEW